MNSTYRYILSTTCHHVTLVGLIYLALLIAKPFFAPDVSSEFILACTLLLIPVTVFVVFHIRPVPQSPVQELALNTFLVVYGGAAALPAAYLLWAAVHPSMALLLVSVYVGVLLFYCVDADEPEHFSPTGRKITYWQQEIQRYKTRSRR